MDQRFIPVLVLAAWLGVHPLFSAAEDAPANQVQGYKDTPMLLGGTWHVHDPDRPQPPVVIPGTFSSPTQPGRPPSDATVLFNGEDLSQWSDVKGGPAQWKLHDGAMIAAGGDIRTKQEFGDVQLHIEFATPTPAAGSGQGRGNSGVFLMGTYELQVLDSYQNPTYPDGQAAALYGQHPPLVNASLPPGQWQVYDILFTAPRFGTDSQVKTPAYITVLHNGVAVQNHTAFLGSTGHRIAPQYRVHPPTGPLVLQFHHDPVRYRNIWIRPLHAIKEP